MCRRQQDLCRRITVRVGVFGLPRLIQYRYLGNTLMAAISTALVLYTPVQSQPLAASGEPAILQ